MAGSGFVVVVVESMRMRILKGNWRKLQSCFQLWLSLMVVLLGMNFMDVEG